MEMRATVGTDETLRTMTVTPDWPLVTERLLLRPFAPDDLDALYEIHADENNVRWLYNEARTRADVEELLQHKIAGASLAHEGEWLTAAAVLNATGELVCDVSLLWASQQHRQGEIGFIAHPAHQGHGYTTEAALPLLRFAFETLGLHRVVGRLEPRNAASARVLEKLGMRLEAHLVENEWIKGEWQSELVYAMLEREWTSRPSSSKT